MEQKDRVKLTTSTTFELEQQELKSLYVHLALFQYRYLRVPDYSEQALLKALEKDFKKFYAELIKQFDKDPNNLTLNKVRCFFEMHIKHIKEITAQPEQP